MISELPTFQTYEHPRFLRGSNSEVLLYYLLYYIFIYIYNIYIHPHYYTYQDIRKILELTGMDRDRPIPEGNDVEQVEVPQTYRPLNEEELSFLQSMVSPLCSSINYGIYIFIQTLTVVAGIIG